MKRKNFSRGIDAILNGTDYQEKPEEKATKNKERLARTSMNINSDLYEQVRALAYWERRSLTSLLNEAVESLLESRGQKCVKDAMKCFLEANHT